MKKRIQIGNIFIGSQSPVFIIAEIGINHNGDIELAKKLISSAKECGVDCVKFQTFKANRVVTPAAPKAKYQLKVTDTKESQLKMLEKVELDFDAHVKLKQYADNLGVFFMSTPYNEEDIELLDKLDVEAFKVASGQIVEIPFLKSIAKNQKPIFLSTGMATIAEIDNAVRAISSTGNHQIILLQCTTNYPSSINDANLRVIPSMNNTFNLPIGYSDHTLGSETAIAAVALGACVIEKHFTLDKSMEGPDHTSSMIPDELHQLVSSIRKVEQSLGSSIKFPTPVELQNAIGMRRSLTASCSISKGQKITEQMITFKRPGTGLSSDYYESVIGKNATRDIAENEMISLDMILWTEK